MSPKRDPLFRAFPAKIAEAFGLDARAPMAPFLTNRKGLAVEQRHARATTPGISLAAPRETRT
jgi:hypothetical protein